MRRPIIVLGSVGALFLLAAVVWFAFAPGQLVKYPDDLNQTAVAKGTVTLYLNPTTGAPVSSPQALPLTIQRNLRVVASTDSQATVQETSTERVGPLAPQQLLQRYALDRTSLKNLAGPGTYAYTPANVVDRKGVYSINLPFSTGDGPYLLYKNETGTSYAFSRSGDNVERDGLTLVPLRGRLTNAAATSAYLDQLAGQGVRRKMTIAQLAPQLKAKGVDIVALSQRLLPVLTATDRQAVQSMLAAPVPINYLVSADTRLLVEPTTGAIVSLANVDQTLSAVPDLSGLAKLATLLAKPEYAGNAVVQGTLTALKGLNGSDPVKVMRLQYAQTPASVATIAGYAQGKADDIRVVRTLIPFGLIVLGIVCILGATALATVGPRKRLGVTV